MPLSVGQCKQFDSFLHRRTPDWDKELSQDRFPFQDTFRSLYPTATWPNGTGTEHTWDKIHVTRIQDNGCWDAIDIDACIGNPCDPPRSFVGWGSSRETYGRYKKVYQTPPFCFDQLRDTEMGIEKLAMIIKGLKKQPNQIISDYMRMWTLRSAETLYIAGTADLRLALSAGMFTNNCTRLDLGGAGNLPTSQLTMSYLDHHVEELLQNGYFDQAFTPAGKFFLMSDIQTNRNLAVGNTTLADMYKVSDFAKAGAFFDYGVSSGVGNWLLKVDSEPIRFQHLSDGVLERVFPFENTVADGVGKKPVVSQAYIDAPYQRYLVYNKAARTVYTPTIEAVNGDMTFNTNRPLNGRWQWVNPDVIITTDPNTGLECTLRNDLHNKGYFVGEFELAVKTEFHDIEMNIIALRQPQVIVDEAYVGAQPDEVTQELLPYNLLCGDE